MGRLRSEVALAEAQAEIDAVAARLAEAHPRTNANVGARVIPLQAWQVGGVRPSLLLLQGAVLFVLLIACVNVANLMLARCTRRAPELPQHFASLRSAAQTPGLEDPVPRSELARRELNN